MKSSGDGWVWWLHGTGTALDTTKLDIWKWLRWRISCSVCLAIIFKDNNFKNQRCRFLNSVYFLQIKFSGGGLRNCFSKLCVWFWLTCNMWGPPLCNVAHIHSGKPGPRLQCMGWATHKKLLPATIRNHCFMLAGITKYTSLLLGPCKLLGAL